MNVYGVLGSTDGERPATRAQRLLSLDVLRGFALLGIFMTNVNHFASPEEGGMHDMPIGAAKPAFVGWHAHLDLLITAVKWCFFESRMRTLFEILFGAGVILLLTRIELGPNRDKAADIFSRRNMWLALFGIMHFVFVWSGDILFDYAFVALLTLYPLRNLSPKCLIYCGLFLSLGCGTIAYGAFYNAPAVLKADDQLAQARIDAQLHKPLTPAQRNLLAQASHRWSDLQGEADKSVRKTNSQSYIDSVLERASGFIKQKSYYYGAGALPDLLGPMLIGMALFRMGFLSGALTLRTYGIVALVGYGLSVPLSLLGVWEWSKADYSMAAYIRWLALPTELVCVSGAIANASVVLILFKKGWMRPVTKSLAAVGRMAFSNYIGTSLLCDWLFLWGPFHLYGKLEFYQQLYVVAGVWAVNIIVSLLWLKVFAFGPLEWVWRSLTYWRLQSLRLEREPKNRVTLSALS